MHNIKQSGHGQEGASSENYHSTPYWKRAHRDWRVWVGAILILVALIIYITSEDFAFLPHFQHQPTDPINTAAVNVSGMFIRDKSPSGPSLRIKESKVVETGTDSTYHVNGLVEGYSPMNYPVSVEHFTEVIRYLGGDPNAQKNWDCIEIYVGNKKVK